jgi:hypothetical protein
VEAAELVGLEPSFPLPVPSAANCERDVIQMTPAPQEAAAPNPKRVKYVALPSGCAEMPVSLKAQVCQAQFRDQRVVNERRPQ